MFKRITAVRWTIRSIAISTALGLIGPSFGDLQIGVSRFDGMGGAGLALPFGGSQTLAYNAARYAYNRGFNVSGLDLGYQISGIGLSDLSNLLKTNSGSGFGTSNLVNIAQNFGHGNIDAGLEGGLSFGIGPISVGASGGAVIATRPNAALQAWAKGNTSDITTIDPNSFLDAYGYGYTSLDFGAGGTFGPAHAQGATTIGGRLRFMRGYYAHYQGGAAQIIASAQGGTVNLQAPELGTSNFLDKNSVGGDFGTQVQLDRCGSQFVGLEVDNLIEPKVSFQGTPPGGSAVVNQTFSAFRRQINLGYGAATKNRQHVFALDVHDLGNHAGFQELRFGGSAQLTQWLAVSAGMGTVNGPSLGLEVFGIGVSISRQRPLEIAKVFRF